MNKVLAFVCLICLIQPAYAVLPTDASIIQVHDMQMINQQRFRMEVLNDYNDVETEKARFEKKNAPREPLINKLFKKKKFVEVAYACSVAAPAVNSRQGFINVEFFCNWDFRKNQNTESIINISNRIFKCKFPVRNFI